MNQKCHDDTASEMTIHRYFLSVNTILITKDVFKGDSCVIDDKIGMNLNL